MQTGLTYFDVLENRKQKQQNISKNKNTSKKVFLVAPTWKDNNIIEKYGVKPLKDLVNLGYQVILRPHPQMFISKKKIIEKIEQEISELEFVSMDKSSSTEDVMSAADILISDLSGIIFDFYFVFEKPVIVIDGLISKSGQEAELVSKELWEIDNLKTIASVMPLEQINNIQKHIEIAQEKTTKEKIVKFREESLFNYGIAGEVAANQILEKINQ